MDEIPQAREPGEQAADTPATDARPAVAVAEAPPPAREPGRRRKLLYATLPGAWGALIVGCLSFTPSLLPRSGIVQGLIWGITAAIGYGLGVLAAWIWRAFPDRGPRRRVTLHRLEGAQLVVVVQFEGIPGASTYYPPSMPLLVEEND